MTEKDVEAFITISRVLHVNCYKHIGGLHFLL